MGLDMMLYRANTRENLNKISKAANLFESIKYGTEEMKSEIETELLSLNLTQSEYESAKRFYYDLKEKVGYWRKFNALHGWFVDNCQAGVDDCGYYEVTEENLNALIELLKTTKETNDSSLLPSRSGFFFGSTEVGEYYWTCVNESIKNLSKVKEETDFNTQTLIYHSSW